MGLKYVCGVCGEIFDEEEGLIHDEDTGFYSMVCPYCGDDTETEECIICEDCGRPVPKSEAIHGYCRECAEDRFLTPTNIKSFLSDRKYFRDFIDMIFDSFSESTIVDVLYEAFPEECEDFCNSSDFDVFVDFVDV